MKAFKESSQALNKMDPYFTLQEEIIVKSQDKVGGPTKRRATLSSQLIRIIMTKRKKNNQPR
jgi:hypothetical protein